MTSNVVRTSLRNDDFKRITFGFERPFKLGGGPLGKQRAALGQPRGVGRCKVSLLMRISDEIEEHLVGPGGMKAVVRCPQIEVIPEAHTALDTSMPLD